MCYIYYYIIAFIIYKIFYNILLFIAYYNSNK